MIRKLFAGILVLILLAGAAVAWRFLLSNTRFNQKSSNLYIRTGEATKEAVLKSLDTIISNPGSFDLVANRLDVWDNLTPGKYEIKKGTSLLTLARMLRNHQQSPVNFTITKVRTKEGLAGMIGKKFECDSLSAINYMNNQDTLAFYGLDSNTIITAVFPNTYTYFWNSTPSIVFRKFFSEYKTIWNEDRKTKAAKLGLSPTEVYILASIVEEETNAKSEKDTIASVYRNRIKKSMRLGADPTVKFALRDFSLKRIYEKHLAVVSPYNTYRVFGLPPGPICTPSLETLDEVLNSPETEYLYFVAKADLSGTHLFAKTYNDHLKFAKMYRQTLDSLQRSRQASKEDL
ncbi:MAG: endolytic transglycosylase MltG [Chitinophagaceae bacterium]|nr:MAG: endolytic transglycosylase MltG [Chitinophagaceae bacterium]